MGLDIFVGHPDREGNSIHYSYSGFADFRRRIARQIGIDLDRMVGFGGRRGWGKIDDPLLALLYHPDCQDKIRPTACRAAAPRLREVVLELGEPSEDEDVQFGLELADLMEECTERRMWLHFC
jgi:hypothetical protein